MKRTVNYVKHPELKIQTDKKDSFRGWAAIRDEIQSRLAQIKANEKKDRVVICIDDYQGTDKDELFEELIAPLEPDHVIDVLQAKKPEAELQTMLEYNLTDDRVFGSMSTHKMKDFFDLQKLADLKETIKNLKGLVVVYGEGGDLAARADLTIYCDLTRWEIQLRYRAGMDNWEAGNYGEDILRKYKRGYFVEWRVMDRHKLDVLSHCQYLIDTNVKDDPKMITKEAFDQAIEKFSQTPFRLVPYFDEGIWGGTWMEENFGLKPQKTHYAWAFDGVPEENAICANVNGVPFDMPAMNLVKLAPKSLLGPKVFSRFGAEFPIRFDFLDTMNGGNLSLQVHPLTEYIKEQFGMAYTQDESYYILDADDSAHVYLGVKDGVNPDEFIAALKHSNETGEPFEDAKFVNCFPVKKHDHVLIPAGTVHCSGSGTVVLEISATPYIFTMKLWDWGRVGLDGKPRPINIEHGAKNIQYDRTTDWCKNNLVSDIHTLNETETFKEERTGLHELEFIETRRAWMSEPAEFSTEESVNVLNLIEGEEACIEPLNPDLEPLTVHYGETFIIPESVKNYRIVPTNKGNTDQIAVICARVRV